MWGKDSSIVLWMFFRCFTQKSLRMLLHIISYLKALSKPWSPIPLPWDVFPWKFSALFASLPRSALRIIWCITNKECSPRGRCCPKGCTAVNMLGNKRLPASGLISLPDLPSSFACDFICISYLFLKTNLFFCIPYKKKIE